MNLVVLSHMYPYEGAPHYGTFVKEQVSALRRLIDGKMYVISPVPWAPRALWFRERWRRYGMAGRASLEDGVKVLRPRYLNLPGARSLHVNSRLMCLSVKKALSGVLAETGAADTLVHSHALLPDGLAGAMAARRFGLGSLCTLHGSDINVYPFFSKAVYRRCRAGMAMNDSLIAVSRKVRERALKILPEAEIDVITNGVDVSKFSPGERGGSGPRRIVFVGRAEEVKGVKELAEAFARIRIAYPDTRLVLVGEPVLKGWLSGFARENGLEGAIEMPGAVPHDELPAYYRSGHIFVLPSYSEGMPVVMFEAMASGLPVVASAVGGVPEVIRHLENGLLIKPRSADDIVEKVLLLLRNPALAGRIARTALAEARGRYTWESSARMLVGKYKELLKLKRKGTVDAGSKIAAS